MGVPRADGNWGKCNPNIKKNYRTRCSALIKSSLKNISLWFIKVISKPFWRGFYRVFGGFQGVHLGKIF